MKKISIATTIDDEPTAFDLSSPRKMLKPIPCNIPSQYTEVTTTQNWIYLAFGAAYLLECAGNPLETELVLSKIASKELSLKKCTNIPKHLRGVSEQGVLLDYIKTAMGVAEEIATKDQDLNYKVHRLLTFMDNEDTIAFAVVVLVRSLLLSQAAEFLNLNKVEFLGNQAEVIADYSLNPAYKILWVMSKTFNYSISVVHKDIPELNKEYSLPESLVEIKLIRHKNRQYYYLKGKEEPTIRKRIISEVNIKRRKISFDSQREDHPESARKMTNELKEVKVIRETKQSNFKVPQPVLIEPPQCFQVLTPTMSRIRVCLSCGQQRNAEQKFCPCKKQKTEQKPLPTKM